MSKAKLRYRREDGTPCVGVTTILGELGWNKNVLIAWANRLGLQGIESGRYVDDKASIGTLAHAIVLETVGGEKVNTDDYSANQIALAKNCLRSFEEWKKGKTVEPILIESRMVSETLGIGGTPDFYGKINGVLTLVDYKTGKGGCYPEYIIQVSVYALMLEESGHQVDEIRVLNIPRSDDESFTETIVNQRQRKAGVEVFKHLLAIYNLKNAIKKDD